MMMILKLNANKYDQFKNDHTIGGAFPPWGIDAIKPQMLVSQERPGRFHVQAEEGKRC